MTLGLRLNLRVSRIQSWRANTNLFFKSNLQYPGNCYVAKLSNCLLFRPRPTVKSEHSLLPVSHIYCLTCVYGKRTSAAAEMLGLPKPPKKPIQSFINFAIQEHEKCQNLSHLEKVKKVSMEWKNLDNSHKAKYNEQYKNDKQIYKKKKLDYLESLSPKQVEELNKLTASLQFEKKVSSFRNWFRKECERLGIKKQPVTATYAFIERYQLKNKLPEDWTKIWSMWNELSESEKEEFRLESQNKLSICKDELHMSGKDLTCIYGKTTAADMVLPKPPKRPLAPFLRFIAEERKKYPGLSRLEVDSIVMMEWKALDESYKAKCRENFVKEKEIYKKKKSDFLESLSPKQVELLNEQKANIDFNRKVFSVRKQFREECKRMGKPKPPGNSVAIFIEKCKLDNSQPQENLLHLLIKWKELPESEKEEFKLEAKKKQTKFKEELQMWENKMREAGRNDLVQKKPL